MSLRPRHGKQWRLFSVSKVGHACDSLCNKKFSLKHCAASTTSPWDMRETEAVGSFTRVAWRDLTGSRQ